MKYRHVWPGLLLLTALSLLLGALLIWGDHFLTPTPAGGIPRLLQVLTPNVTLEASQSHDVPRAVSDAPVAAEFESSSPASDLPDPTPDDGSMSGAGAPVVLTRSPARPTASTAPQVRYALDIGTFAIEEDAERAEVQLNQAGFSTVRFRQRAPARLFAVSLAPLPGSGLADESTPDALLAMAGLGAPALERVWVARALPLRSAVALAERLRSEGHEVHIVAEAVKVGEITLRHGNFASRREAEAASRDVADLGVPNEIIQIK